MLVGHAPNFIQSAEAEPRREDTPSYALRAALALRLAAPHPAWVPPVSALPLPASIASPDPTTGSIAA